MREGTKHERIAHVVKALRPSAVAKTTAFPPTPTPWAATYRVDWPDLGDSCVVRILDGNADPAETAVEFAAAQRFAEIGVGPGVRMADPAAGVLVMDFIGGAPARPPSAPQALALADALARLHGADWHVDLRLYASKREAAKATVRELTAAHDHLTLYRTVLDEFDGLRGGLAMLDSPRALCHNDLNPTNVLFDGDTPWLIDFDHVGLGDPLFDVATAMKALDLRDERADRFVTRYLGRPATDVELARLELLSCLALLRYGLMTLTLVPADDLSRLASWGPDQVGEAFVFARPAGESFGGSIFRLSLGFATEGLARLRAEPARAAAGLLRIPVGG
ncbi:phosphotransferase [Micromonospora sp. NPDC093244]|uniref:phosphotransferase n=1 Tax=Micromonospora sp. NPDC093244 TaxID=3155071 RepID=UPI00342C4785